MEEFNPPKLPETESEIRSKFEWQLENCARIKGTEVQRFTCVDSKGKVTRKVVIEFDDEPEDPMINWKQKMEQYCNKDWEIRLLREGATSSTTAMGLMVLKNRYKTIMSIDD